MQHFRLFVDFRFMRGGGDWTDETIILMIMERAVSHVKEVNHQQQLSATSRNHALNLANNWRALQATRWVFITS